jgi:hypothetical protein
MSRRRRQAIDAVLEHGLPSALIEPANTKDRAHHLHGVRIQGPLRALTLAMISFGDYRAPLSGRIREYVRKSILSEGGPIIEYVSEPRE